MTLLSSQPQLLCTLPISNLLFPSFHFCGQLSCPGPNDACCHSPAARSLPSVPHLHRCPTGQVSVPVQSLSEASSPLPPGLHPQHYPQPFIAQLSEGPFLSHSSALEGASRQPGEPSDPFNKSAPSLPSRVLSSPKAVHPPLGCPAPRPDPQDPCLALSGPTSLEPYLQALFPVLQHPPRPPPGPRVLPAELQNSFPTRRHSEPLHCGWSPGNSWLRGPGPRLKFWLCRMAPVALD